MTRRIAFVSALLAVAALWTVAPQSQATPGGGGCVLQGTANFKPGLTNSAVNFTYNFAGTLTNCHSDPSQSKAPTSGVVSAGQVITIAGTKYQEPIPTGNGSCGSGDTKGISLITWNDKTQTVVSYTTKSATGAVFLGGPQSNNFAATVLPSVSLKKVGGTTYYTFKTTRYNGAGSIGVLTFSPKDPTACNSTGGVTSAGIAGFTGIGSAK